MKYLNNFTKYLKENLEDEEIDEILDSMDGDYIEIDMFQKSKFLNEKEKIPFGKYEEKYLDNKLKFYAIEVDSYIDRVNEFVIKFNKLNGDCLDIITIIKFEHHWYIADININGENEYFICNETEGLLSLIKDHLFKYSKNEKFLQTFFTTRKKNLSEIISKKDNKFIFYSNPTLANMIIDRVDILMPDNMTKNIVAYMNYAKINTLSNYYYLYENKKISLQSLLIEYPAALEERDGILYLRFYGRISDLSFMYDKNDSNRNSYSSHDFVEKYKEEDLDYGYHNSNFRDIYLGNLTLNAVNLIKAKIEETKKDMDEEGLELFTHYTDWEEQIEHIDALSEVKQAICNAYDDALESGEHDAEYEGIIKPLLNFMRMKEMIYIDEGFLFSLNKEWLIKYDFMHDSSSYSGYASKERPRVKELGKEILEYTFTDMEYSDEIYEVTKLKIDFPYYGWSGDIDEPYLEDRIGERLSEIR